MAPEGQADWEQYGDTGVVFLGMMLETSSGSLPASEDAARWADTYGLTHPVIADASGQQSSWVASGYPTYVVLDQTMTVIYDDLWPFDITAAADLVGELADAPDDGDMGIGG